MRFTAEQRFPGASPAEVATAFADPALYDHYPAGDRLAAPTVVDHRVDGDIVELALQYRFTGDLSSAVRAVVDPARLTWVERTRHDLASGTATFALQPDHYTDRLRCTGTVRITADADGSRRVIEGDLKVKVTLVGGTVERTLVADLQGHLRQETAIVERFLQSRSG
jgi:hypothetical protein